MMMWRGVALAALIVTGVYGAAAQDAQPDYSVPLGSALETYPYPFAVDYLPLKMEGEDVWMAYMDVAPAEGATANGRSVVLMHGKNFYGSYWEQTAKALAAEGYRVVIPDQIGFGKSSKPAVDYSFDTLSSNTAALLDSLAIEKVSVVGHSMGGMLATRFTRVFPDRVEKLVLENPIGLEDYRFNVPPLSTDQVYHGELNNADPEKIRNFLKTYVVDWKPEVFERFVEVRTRLAHGGEFPRWARAAALTYQMIYREPVVHEFGLIKTPTLIVIGQKDRTTLGRNFVAPEVIATMGNYPVLGRKTAEAIEGSKLIELENVGHIPHLEVPERFHKDLIEFMK